MYMTQGPYYSASPYYRHPGMVAHPQQPQAQPHVNLPQNGGQFQPSEGVPSGAHSAQSSPATAVREVSDTERQHMAPPADAPPVIDPSLQKPADVPDAHTTNTPLAQANGANGAKDGWQLTQEAVQAVLDFEKRRMDQQAANSDKQSQNDGLPQRGIPQIGQQPQTLSADQIRPDADAQVYGAEKTDKAAAQQQIRAQGQGMPQMMTEDGEPMLNPAELLTQESLASPPP